MCCAFLLNYRSSSKIYGEPGNLWAKKKEDDFYQIVVDDVVVGDYEGTLVLGQYFSDDGGSKFFWKKKHDYDSLENSEDEVYFYFQMH